MKNFRRFIRTAVLLTGVLMLSGLLLADAAQAQSSVRPPGQAAPLEEDSGPSNALGGASDADIWRQIRGAEDMGGPDLPAAPGRNVPLYEDLMRELQGGIAGGTSSTAANSRLIQMLGEDWRHIRRDYILPYAGWVLAGVLGLLVVFRLIRGKIRIEAGRSGKYIPRFSMAHRIAHWYLAASFIIMAITGLIILLGRPLLAPYIGKDATAIMASASLQGHNLFGPVFILALLIMIFRFMKGNFFQWADLKWILKGGGLLGGHASSNHYNFGEKTWYWIVVIVGLIMSATGMLLLFPWVTDVLAWHQISTVLHAGGAILLIAIALGHAYVGSIGMEGSIDSMLRGEVDENWAKEHHDLWYEEVTGKKVDHKTGAIAQANPEAAE
ncbi:formate dehydrogenase subunit gamma [Marimonas arenosa]|uniref:Formate dehydrogenase subunit gamma n=1 Tax=Marimonas arenosa TaxID=1795305 RepID=A0AAE4B7B5_9RHOB|nr:formate dehydrogenase subunit gamma [Marimonas arenosa]MDQ2092179.1 formate dehydrogenase subunit gamma [Marimonas arenosa]